MRLDTECDISFDVSASSGQRGSVLAFRNGLVAEHLGVDTDTLVSKLGETRSVIATIEALRGPGKTLKPYVTPDLGTVEKWLADNEVLDPEGPAEMFEATTKRGLFRRRW